MAFGDIFRPRHAEICCLMKEECASKSSESPYRPFVSDLPKLLGDSWLEAAADDALHGSISDCHCARL